MWHQRTRARASGKGASSLIAALLPTCALPAPVARADALSGGVLDASTTFTAIALFGNLQGPLFLVPQAISQVR